MTVTMHAQDHFLRKFIYGSVVQWPVTSFSLYRYIPLIPTLGNLIADKLDLYTTFIMQ